MAGYSYHLIVGNLGADPEMRYTPSGRAVCNFRVAVGRKWTDKNTNELREKTTWYRVAAWGTLAENCNTYLAKGKQVLVVGREMAASAYLGKEDGEPKASLELTALEVQFLGKKLDNGGDYEEEDESYPTDPNDLPF